MTNLVRGGVASLSNTTGDKKDRASYCQGCLKVKIMSPLRHRLYLDKDAKINPNPPPDADKWRQYWQCGNIVGVHRAKQQAEIITITQPTDNPFKVKHSSEDKGKDSRLSQI